MDVLNVFAPGGRLGNVELNTRYNICGSKLWQKRSVKRISLRFRSVGVFLPLRFVARKRNGNFFLSATVSRQLQGKIVKNVKLKLIMNDFAERKFACRQEMRTYKFYLSGLIYMDNIALNWQRISLLEPRLSMTSTAKAIKP